MSVHPIHRGNGFSLVELSIVLVILGLLTGGILSGQALIRAAELRSITAQSSQYVTAIYSFRDKYFALPGDFAEATRFWGQQYSGATCAAHSGAAVTTPGACNGNGNGILTVTGGAGLSSEAFQSWRHLALAGLVEGSYTGLAGTAAEQHAIPGENIPAGKVSNTGFGLTFRNSAAGTGTITQLTEGYGHYLMIGRGSADNWPYNPFASRKKPGTSTPSSMTASLRAAW